LAVSSYNLALPVRRVSSGSARGGLGGLASVTEQARGAGQIGDDGQQAHPSAAARRRCATRRRLVTNVVSRVLDGEERVLGPLAAVEPHEVGIPLLVLVELLFGAEKSGRRDQNRQRIEMLTERFPVLPLGIAIVRRYAIVRAEVERRGRRKSDFDRRVSGWAYLR